MSTSSHVTELLPAYALGSLDEPEATVVRAHLLRCDQCRRELRDYEDVVAELLYALPATSPPPELKQRVLDAATGPSDNGRAVSQPGLTWRQLMRGWSRGQLALAASALALILFLTVSNVTLLLRVRTLESRYATTTGLYTVILRGSEAAPEALAILIAPGDSQQGALVVDDLRPLDPAHVYQLWLIDEKGQRDNGGVFTVDETGHVAISVTIPKPLPSYKAFGVTIEPLGGSSGPTGPKVLGGT